MNNITALETKACTEEISTTIFHSGTLAPLDKHNVDTDQIIPRPYLSAVTRDGLAEGLFQGWRYNSDGVTPDPAFSLNEARYQGASVLLTRDNFGCGSSREHAPWALAQYGFSVIIAPSFADIFYNNCLNNRILPISLAADKVQALFDEVELSLESLQVEVDLNHQVVKAGSYCFHFDIEEGIKQRLLSGLDLIGFTETMCDKIADFEEQAAC